MNMETTNIYVLIDPRTNIVRYVGKANNITQRYKAHLNRARKHQIHKKNWIEQLKREGLKPIIEVIDIVPITEWVFWETYWISQMKTWGFNLINYTNGGDGCTFANQTSFKKGQGGKKVVGYNSNFEKIYEFDSTRQACEALKINGVWASCSGRHKTSNGIAWFYYEDIKNLLIDDLNEKIKERYTIIMKPNSGSFKKGQKGTRCKKVILIDLNTNEKYVFDSGVDAGKFIDVKQSKISWALRNNKIIKKQFKIEKYE